MVQGKKQLNSKPKFAEVVIGDNEAKEMRESAKVRNRRNPSKLSYPNGVTLILPADISIEQFAFAAGMAANCVQSGSVGVCEATSAMRQND